MVRISRSPEYIGSARDMVASRRLAIALAMMILVADAWPQRAEPPSAGEVSRTNVEQDLARDDESIRFPQSPEPDRRGGSNSRNLPTFRNTGMETFYVRDAAGELVPVPSMTYEDFVRLYELDRKLNHPEQPPRYSLYQSDAVVSIDGDRAAVDITFQIKLLVDGTTRIPLRLPQAVLAEPAKHSGDGEHVLESEETSGGYACWLRGKTGQSHTLRLKLIASVMKVGGESRLSLALPRAASSKIRLIVPQPEATATTLAPARIVSRRSSRESTEFSVVGAAGDFQIAWGNERAKIVEKPLMIEATGTVRVRVKGPGSVTTQARFRLTSFGRKMGTVRIELPYGAKPIAVDDPKYALEFVETTPVDDGGPTRMIAIVKFHEPTTGPIDVQLAIEQSRSPDNSDTAIDVLGFEVIDAHRHYGTVAIATSGDWQVRWPNQLALHRLGSIPESLTTENLVAAFEYFQQPASLPLDIQTKPTRINVDPLYVIDVDETTARLRAELKFRVRGAAASFLQLDFASWKVTKINSEGLVDDLDVPITDGALLELPLKPARSGDFQLTIIAEQPIAAGTSSLQLHLPSCRNATSESQLVVINPAEDILLSLHPKSMALFESESIPEDFSPAMRQPRLMAYRYRGEPNQGVLRFDFGNREQSITVASDIRIDITSTQLVFRQMLKTTVRYQPLEQILLRIPSQVTDNPTFRLSLDGDVVELSRLRAIKDLRYPPVTSEPVLTVATTLESFSSSERADSTRNNLELNLPTDAAKVVPPEPTDVGQAESTDGVGNVAENRKADSMTNLRQWWALPLSPPREGNLAVEVSYTVPSTGGMKGEPLELPCIDTASGNVAEASLTVVAVPSVAVEVNQGSDWVEDVFTGGEQGRRYRTNAQPGLVQLNTTRISPERRRPAVADRVFVQTWMTRTGRQDRVAMQLTARSDLLRIQLPTNAMDKEAIVLRNGVPLNVVSDEEGWLSIPAAIPNEESECIELSYRFRDRPRNFQPRIEFPKIDGATWIRKFYWQLVVPSDEHLLVYPTPFSAEDDWERKGIFYRRIARKTQAELEAWVGATSQSAPLASNVYLSSGFGDLADGSPLVVGRPILLGLASGFVLSFGLIARILPWRWLKWLIVPVVTSLLASAWLLPAPTMIVGQAALCGIVLLVLGWSLDRTLGRVNPSLPEGQRYVMPSVSSSHAASVGSSQAARRSTRSSPVPMAASEP